MVTVISVHLGNYAVGQQLQTIMVPVSTELSTSMQSWGWKQNMFNKCKNSILFHDSTRKNSFAYPKTIHLQTGYRHPNTAHLRPAE